MSRTATIGLLAGLLLALAATTGGIGGLILAIVLGTVGLLAGLQVDGSIDVRAIVRSRSRG
ncbi:hypothetical protein [Gordonia neofelifaecis]|uniref:DUF2273 domain-containing protein n=1 Tax=Gordonia neofelifaecis NRRL B-59395 TaxID=644548 RepID=F1YK95_9ACTN|nr:hypothetical protein [Gordonia neofelifaecis]EGD54941.1 hypothetical protein SCNU_12060 [Gordonia neofelifaecis NRRL B-59395]